MKKLILLSAVLFASSCVLATASVINDNQMESGTAMGGRAQGLLIRHIEHRLGMTEAQRTQIRQILITERPAVQALASRVQAQRKELQALEAQGFDEQQVRGFAAAHQQTTADVLVEHERVRTQILQVLTVEQRQRLEQMRAEWSGVFADRLATLGERL